MKAALTLCLMLLCNNIYAQPDSLQNLDVKTVKIELTKLHKGVKSRFKYRNQSRETFKYYDSLARIRGDCDDFASAAYFELWKLKANPIMYTYDRIGGRERYRHVIVCAMGYCFDNNRDGVVPEQSFRSKVEALTYRLVEGGTGQLNEEQMVALYEQEQIKLGVKQNELF